MTLYQFGDPSPTTPTPRKEEESGKNSRQTERERAALANEKTFALLLKPARPTRSNTGSTEILRGE